MDLFDRSAHPAALTAAGQRFLPLLEAVLANLEAARIKARAATTGPRPACASRRRMCCR